MSMAISFRGQLLFVQKLRSGQVSKVFAAISVKASNWDIHHPRLERFGFISYTARLASGAVHGF